MRHQIALAVALLGISSMLCLELMKKVGRRLEEQQKQIRDNALIIDLVLAAVLAVFALLGARKGLIRSLMALVSVVVALIGATLLTAMFVEPVTDLVYPKVEERVLEQFERDIPSDALAAEDGDLSAGGQS